MNHFIKTFVIITIFILTSCTRPEIKQDVFLVVPTGISQENKYNRTVALELSRHAVSYIRNNSPRYSPRLAESLPYADDPIYNTITGSYLVGGSDIVLYLLLQKPNTLTLIIKTKQNSLVWYDKKTHIGSTKGIMQQIQSSLKRFLRKNKNKAEPPPPDPIVNVSITSSPPGAKVFISDVFRGITPCTVPMRISSFEWHFKLMKNGYKTWEKNTVIQGKMVINATLTNANSANP